MALYRAISAHSSTVVSLEDTVSGKAPVSPVKWLCIGLSVHSLVPSHSPKRTEGGGVWVHRLNFWVVLTLHFPFLNYQSDPPDGLSRDTSQELPWIQIMHKAIVSSSFCQLCLSMLSERAEYSFLPWMHKSQSPRSRPRYEA